MLLGKDFCGTHVCHLQVCGRSSFLSGFCNSVGSGCCNGCLSTSHISLKKPHHWVRLFKVREDGIDGFLLRFCWSKWERRNKVLHNIFLYRERRRLFVFAFVARFLYGALNDKYFFKGKSLTSCFSVFFFLWGVDPHKRCSYFRKRVLCSKFFRNTVFKFFVHPCFKCSPHCLTNP